jgi:hypothetical protein
MRAFRKFQVQLPWFRIGFRIAPLRSFIGYLRICEQLIVALARLKDNIVGRLDMFLQMFD